MRVATGRAAMLAPILLGLALPAPAQAWWRAGSHGAYRSPAQSGWHGGRRWRVVSDGGRWWGPGVPVAVPDPVVVAPAPIVVVP